MVDPLNHPAADRETAQAVVVEQDRRVVALTGWLTDAAVSAARDGRVLQILTPLRSQITYPLELFIDDGHAQWIVREDEERFRDGFTGEPLHWDGARFAAAGAPGPLVATGSESVEVQITTLHRAHASLQLGLSTEAAVQALTGGRPSGWGVAEPASEPWSPRELTRHCEQRAPNPSTVVLVGGQDSATAIGTIEVTRVQEGVRERLRLAGPAARAVGRAAIDQLAAAVAGNARSMLVATQPGRLDGLRWNKPNPPPLPHGILLGHRIVAEHGAEHARRAPAQVQLLGLDSRQAAWCSLTDDSRAPYEVLTDVLEHFGQSARE